jgi:hypothetical protein
MARLAWATDIHLNFLDDEERRAFLAQLASGDFEALLLSGDIAESPGVVGCLHELAGALGRRILFVLGNHDFYRGGIASTRDQVAAACADWPNLLYLSRGGIVAISDQTAVVGHDGWGDAMLGDFENSRALVSDFRVIDELKLWKVGPHTLEGLKLDEPVEQDLMKWTLRHEDLDREALAPILRGLGQEASQHLATWLPRALETHQQVVVLTHVPPFPEIAWHRGTPCDEDWLPYYTCKSTADVLLDAARRYPRRQILVLCGHTHTRRDATILPNLRAVAGEAEYMEPRIQEIIEVP